MTYLEQLYKKWMALQPLKLEDKNRLDRKFMLEFNYNSNHIEYISIGEVHIPAFNINQYSNVEVKLTPTWVVIDPGMGKSVPTIPGTLNTIPLQLIKSKTYRIK